MTARMTKETGRTDDSEEPLKYWNTRQIKSRYIHHKYFLQNTVEKYKVLNTGSYKTLTCIPVPLRCRIFHSQNLCRNCP